MKISIDKIRLVGKVRDTRVFDRFYTFYCNNPRFHTTDPKAMTSLNKFKYSFTITPVDEHNNLLEGAFYIAFCWNGSFAEQKIDAYRFVIEFNPNKCPRVLLDNFKYFCNPLFKEIKSLDLAFDIECPRHYVVVSKCNRKYMAIGRGSTLTEYINADKRHARLKVYDKGAERGTNADLTRVEVTISDGLLQMLCPKRLSRSVSTSDIDTMQEVCDVLACVSYFDPCEEVEPLTRLLITANPTERELYISSFSSATRTRIRSKLKTALSAIEFTPFEIISIIEERLSQII